MQNILCSRFFSLGMMILVALLIDASGCPAMEPSTDAAAVYEKAKPALVEVLVNGHLNGSGWFIDPKGTLFTAAHVIEHPDRKVEVTSPSIGRMDATILAVDLGHDLALLEIQPREKPYPALKLASKSPAPGEAEFLFGAPIYRHAVFLRGAAAGVDSSFEYYLDRYNEVTMVTATVPVGMSGGPWLNSQGEAVGLNSGVMSENSIPVGLAFSAPLEALKKLLEKRKSASTPYLGVAVEELWQQDSKMIDRFPPQFEGLLVKVLQADGPAARGNLKLDDMIVSADGKNVRLTDELLRIIAKKQPGESLELNVVSLNGAGQRKATITLGKLEVGWP
jgi:serine protease Do